MKMLNVKEVWDFFQKNRHRMIDNYICIGELPECGVEIYLTEQATFPYFQVEVDGKVEFEAECFNQEQTEQTYRQIIDLIFDDVDEQKAAPVRNSDDGDTSYLLSDDDIVRQIEVLSAVQDMVEILAEASCQDIGVDPGELDSLTFDIEKMLAEQYGIPIRHPTVFEDPSTGEVYVEYYPFGM